MERSPEAARRSAAIGVALVTTGFTAWGFFPIYWKAVQHVGSVELLVHRILWAPIPLIVLLTMRNRWGEVSTALRDRRTLAMLLATTALIGVNWFTFVWAVNAGHVLDASLGYYINPLVNVLLGMVVLGERLRRWQWVAVGLAALGVALLTAAHGKVPWTALILAVSFGLYGLLRKTVRAGAITGLFLEVALLFPFALVYLLVEMSAGRAVFGTDPLWGNVLIALAGPLTVLPLALFTAGARRIQLSTVGLLQYIAPTGHFLLAVFAYGEPFGRVHMATFVLIWTALAIYTIDARARYRSARLATVSD